MPEEITPVSEISCLTMILFLGGAESTAGLTGTLFKLLAENPDQRDLLLADPSLIPAAVEEARRLITPLQLTTRPLRPDPPARAPLLTPHPRYVAIGKLTPCLMSRLRSMILS